LATEEIVVACITGTSVGFIYVYSEWIYEWKCWSRLCN